MIRRRRYAAIAATIATVLGMVAAAVTGLSRRRADASSTSATNTSSPKTAPTRPGPAQAQIPLTNAKQGEEPKPPWHKRTRAYLRRGATSTVGLLTVIGIATGIYAYHLRPDSTLPQPSEPSVDLIFGPKYFASAPLTMTVWLRTQSMSPTGTTMVMDIDLTGKDLTQPGWALLASVPSGVDALDPYNNPRFGRVTPQVGGGDEVYITPEPARQGTYSVALVWNNLTSGPMQVRGANLAATFPDVTVENDTSGTGPNAVTVPTPVVTLSRELQPPGTDYAYIGGLPPDHQDLVTWSWNPPSGFQAGGSTSFGPMTIEARSASADEESHSAEFQSGIFFGVAAAALIVALQEFLNAARKKEAQT
jgi:hypothetical protein